MNLEAFAVELTEKWRPECMDVDGCDLQEMLAKHGIIIKRPATEADCQEEWAQEWGIEVGDPIFVDSPEFIEVKARAEKNRSNWF